MAEVRVTARLEQLSCPSCAEMISNVVGKIKGVMDTEIRYTTSKLLVTYNDSVTDWESIEAAVVKLGYSILRKERRE